MWLLLPAAHAAGYDLDDLVVASQRGMPLETLHAMVDGAPVALRPGEAVLLLRAGVPAAVLRDATGNAHPTRGELGAAALPGPSWEVRKGPAPLPEFPTIELTSDPAWTEPTGWWSHPAQRTRGTIEIGAGAAGIVGGGILYLWGSQGLGQGCTDDGYCVPQAPASKPLAMAGGLALATLGSVTIGFGMSDRERGNATWAHAGSPPPLVVRPPPPPPEPVLVVAPPTLAEVELREPGPIPAHVDEPRGWWTHRGLRQRGAVATVAGAGLLAAGAVVFIRELGPGQVGNCDWRCDYLWDRPSPFALAAGAGALVAGSVTVTFGVRTYAWGVDRPGLYAQRR